MVMMMMMMMMMMIREADLAEMDNCPLRIKMLNIYYVS